MYRFLLFFFCFIASNLPAQSFEGFGDGGFDPTGFGGAEQPVSSSVYTSVETIKAGDSFFVIAELDIKEHWHVFWKHSGGFSLPVVLKDEALPSWLEVERVVYPVPTYHYDDLLESAAYYNEGKAPYLIRLKVSDEAPLGEQSISAALNWQACDPSSCVDGTADITFMLNVGAVTSLKDDAQARLEAVSPKLPSDKPQGWRIYGQLQDDGFIRVTVEAPESGLFAIGKVNFFPNHAALQAQGSHRLWKISGRTASKLFEYRKDVGQVTEIGGTFSYVKEGKTFGLELVGEVGQAEFAVSAMPDSSAEPVVDELPYRRVGGEDAEKNTGLLKNLFFAIVGGLILNLMPCVFPVLSLKVMGFVKQAEQGQGSAFSHAVAFTVGVLVSFWILAGTILALRESGGDVNWGDQLQNPYVTTIVVAVLFALALNLFGVFEVGVSLTSAGQKVKKSGFSGSFMSGVLATVVATPCMAPMLGAALTYAFTQSAGVAMLIFTCVGLGLSLPYLLFALFPQALKLMPKPGAWMETFKKSMGFLMMLAVVWLLESLEGILGMERLLGVLFSMVALAVALWLYGIYSPVYVEKSARIKGMLASLLFFVGALWYANYSINYEDQLEWKKFSRIELSKALAEGKPVFIDFTAKWCATCQVNKKVAIYPNASLFKEKEVVLFKADKTRPNKEINEVLEEFGNIGVPMNLLYDGTHQQPIKFPEVFTEGLLEEELQKINLRK